MCKDLCFSHLTLRFPSTFKKHWNPSKPLSQPQLYFEIFNAFKSMIWSVRPERKVNIKPLRVVYIRQNTSKNNPNNFCVPCIWSFFFFLVFLTISSQGYLPANAERRDSVLQRKRQEYFGFIQQYYDSRNDEHHQDTYRQVYTNTPWPACVHSVRVE